MYLYFVLNFKWYNGYNLIEVMNNLMQKLNQCLEINNTK